MPSTREEVLVIQNLWFAIAFKELIGKIWKGWGNFLVPMVEEVVQSLEKKVCLVDKDTYGGWHNQGG